MRLRAVGFAILCCAGLILYSALFSAEVPASFRFVILGDRTGDSAAGVYESVWQAAAGEKPAFVIGVGDTIEGLRDRTAEAEWQAAQGIIAPYRAFRLYLAPGNHDVWSARSESLFRAHSGNPLHYGFDYGPAHFTVLDNSRSEQFTASELAFLEQDLKTHAGQPVKFVVSHRPSWLVNVVVGDPGFEVHRLAKRYGVQYVIAGHVHEMLHADLEGVSYVSVASSGGHLRASGKYEDGWFYGYSVVEVNRKHVDFRVRELSPPYGQSRANTLKEWGKSGLLH
jgi:3',5'-cyclic-AMP phosphodiesterase